MGTDNTTRAGAATKAFSQEDKDKFDPLACRVVNEYMASRDISCLIPFDIQMSKSSEMYKKGDIIYGNDNGPFILEVECKPQLDLLEMKYNGVPVADIQYAWRKVGCTADYFATIDGTNQAIIFFSCADIFGPDTIFRTKKTEKTDHHPEDFMAVPVKCGHVVYKKDDAWKAVTGPEFSFKQTRTSMVDGGIYSAFLGRVGVWKEEQEAYMNILKNHKTKKNL